MRTVALPSMMESLARNYNNRNDDACLFEPATVYLPSENSGELPEEKSILICGMYGEGRDFFAAKGMVEELFSRLGIRDWWAEACADDPSYHPGRCAKLTSGDGALGVIGEIHPKVMENYGMEGRAVSFSLDENALFAHAQMEKSFTPLPKFPAVSRDLALICDDGIPVLKLENAIRKGAGNLLENVKLFDVYRGKQIEAGKKSVAFSITLRSRDSTLTDKRVSNIMTKIISELEKSGASLRL